MNQFPSWWSEQIKLQKELVQSDLLDLKDIVSGTYFMLLPEEEYDECETLKLSKTYRRLQYDYASLRIENWGKNVEDIEGHGSPNGWFLRNLEVSRCFSPILLRQPARNTPHRTKVLFENRPHSRRAPGEYARGTGVQCHSSTNCD